MTTTTSTPATSPAPAARTSSRGRTIFLTATGVVVAAGVTAGLVFGLGGGSTDAATGTPTPVISTATGHETARHATTAGGTTGHGGNNTPAAPSAAIETLQKELGQLNYYEGPVTGVMNAQTTQAITYLQRDAHLPQTGQMNAATQAALANFLANGNNQMGGNN
jgi:peptidoglycan hydrolase-like protein with peptidoglycan-binding domain